MKKFLALLLAFVLSFGLCACNSEAKPKEEQPEHQVEEVIFNPVSLVNDDTMIFEITSEPYEDEEMQVSAVNVHIKNKTDKTIYVALNGASVNDIMIDPYFSNEIGPNKEGNFPIRFLKEDMKMNEINSIEKVNFKISVFDEDWILKYSTGEVGMEFPTEEEVEENVDK